MASKKTKKQRRDQITSQQNTLVSERLEALDATFNDLRTQYTQAVAVRAPVPSHVIEDMMLALDSLDEASDQYNIMVGAVKEDRG